MVYERGQERCREAYSRDERTIFRTIDKMDEQLTQIADGWMQKSSPTFSDLIESVLQTHLSAQSTAVKAVNQMATLRNWLIGCYIAEYEQKGSDRAKYGDRLLKRLEESVNTKGLNLTLFKVSRNFYLKYPQTGDLLNFTIRPTTSDKFEKGATLSHQLTTETSSPKSATLSHQFVTPAKDVLAKLSFAHIREIMTQDDPLTRFFYEN